MEWYNHCWIFMWEKAGTGIFHMPEFAQFRGWNVIYQRQLLRAVCCVDQLCAVLMSQQAPESNAIIILSRWGRILLLGHMQLANTADISGMLHPFTPSWRLPDTSSFPTSNENCMLSCDISKTTTLPFIGLNRCISYCEALEQGTKCLIVTNDI